jgi:hypothetical protein
MESTVTSWRSHLLFAALEGGIFGAVLGGWRFFTKTPLTDRTAWTVVGFWVVLNLVAAFRKGYSESQAADVRDAGPKQEKRAFVDDSEAILELAKLRGLDAVKQFTPYLGKWMTISGTLEGIAESLRRDAIHLTLVLADSRRINLRFAPEHGEQLRELKAGQRITAICRIQHLGFVFTPENCELIRVEPLKRADRPTLAYAS